MSMWTAIALIAVASILAGIFNDKGKKRHSAEISKELNAINSKLNALEKELRERVETLERSLRCFARQHAIVKVRRGFCVERNPCL